MKKRMVVTTEVVFEDDWDPAYEELFKDKEMCQTVISEIFVEHLKCRNVKVKAFRFEHIKGESK